MSGFKQKFFDVKRRTTQSVLMKIGKAEATPDDEYVERRERALKIFAHIESLHKHCSAYLTSTRSLCIASSDLGVDFNNMFRGGDDRVQNVAEQFGGSMTKVDEEIRKLMDDRIVAEVIEPLNGKLSDFADLQALMSQRDKIKLDYDCYFRNVRSIKEKGGSNVKKLGEKERKLKHAREELEDITSQIYNRFDNLEARRTTLVLAEFRTLTQCLTQFYSTTAGMMTGLGDIPHIDMPAEIPAAVSSAAAKSSISAAASAPEAPPAAESAAAGGDSKGQVRARALYNYAPQNSDELELHEGDIITVSMKQEDGWWEGTVGDKRGVFPANYVEELA